MQMKYPKLHFKEEYKIFKNPMYDTNDNVYDMVYEVEHKVQEVLNKYDTTFEGAMTEQEYCDLIVNVTQQYLITWLQERHNKYKG